MGDDGAQRRILDRRPTSYIQLALQIAIRVSSGGRMASRATEVIYQRIYPNAIAFCMSLFVPWLEFNVRREKGASMQWEEASPPGNCCSSRKQPERLGPVTARVEASGVKGPLRGLASTQVET
jgi:hypothetical protein